MTSKIRILFYNLHTRVTFLASISRFTFPWTGSFDVMTGRHTSAMTASVCTVSTVVWRLTCWMKLQNMNLWKCIEILTDLSENNFGLKPITQRINMFCWPRNWKFELCLFSQLLCLPISLSFVYFYVLLHSIIELWRHWRHYKPWVMRHTYWRPHMPQGWGFLILSMLTMTRHICLLGHFPKFPATSHEFLREMLYVYNITYTWGCSNKDSVW